MTEIKVHDAFKATSMIGTGESSVILISCAAALPFKAVLSLEGKYFLSRDLTVHNMVCEKRIALRKDDEVMKKQEAASAFSWLRRNSKEIHDSGIQFIMQI